MGHRNPFVPQVNDPELEADLIRLLSIVGALGTLNVVDTVVPTVSLGSIADEIDNRSPVFLDTDIHSEGVKTAPTASLLLADTGQLNTGIYDISIALSSTEVAVDNTLNIEHRNAANTGTVRQWTVVHGRDNSLIFTFNMAMSFTQNERLTVRNQVAGTAARVYSAVIFKLLRP